MIDALTYALVVIALIQPTPHRRYTAMTFAAFTFAHNMFMYPLEGIAYYASDALFYVAVMAITCKFNDIAKLTINIHRLCIAAIVLDAFGWVLWMAYLPPDVYNAAFVALYATAVVVLLIRDESDVRGGGALGGWNNYLRVIIGKGDLVFKEWGKAA